MHQRAENRRYRALARAAAVQSVTVSEEERAVARASARVLRGRLAEALAALPARDRDVLLLVAVGGLSYEEVSQALSVPPGTVGSRLSRARIQVRNAFGGVNPLPDDSADDNPGVHHG